MAAARPTLTVVTGDLTQRARPHEFAAAVAFLGRLPTPVVVVLGNHDVPLDRLQRVTSPYRAYRAPSGSRPRPDRRRPRRPRARPAVDAAVALEERPGLTPAGGPGDSRPSARPRRPPSACSRCITPVSVTGAAALVGRTRLLDALAGAQVELVLAGHTHRASTTWFELETAERSWCVLEGIAGSATSTRLRGTPRSWSLYRIDATTITTEERWESAGTWATGDLRHLRRRSLAAAAAAAVAGRRSGS